MTTLDGLKEIRKLIKNGWTKEAYARDKYGSQIEDIFSAAACYFCLTGAIDRVCVGEAFQEKESIVRALTRVCGPIICFNDHEETKKKDVLDVIDEAIENLEGTAR